MSQFRQILFAVQWRRERIAARGLPVAVTH
jgi:hypothetical protein